MLSRAAHVLLVITPRSHKANGRQCIDNFVLDMKRAVKRLFVAMIKAVSCIFHSTKVFFALYSLQVEK